MGEPADIRGYPVQDHTPAGSHHSMLAYPPVPREPPIDTEYPRTTGLQSLQGPPLHPNSQMSSFAPRESSFQMPQEPAGILGLQKSQCQLVPPGISMQSSLQNYPVPMSELCHQIPQCPLVPSGTPMQSSLQWHSDCESYLGPQVSPGPPMKTTPCKYPGPLMYPINPCPQPPSCSPGSSGFEHSIDSLNPTNTNNDQKNTTNSSEIQKKIRIVYSKEQKLQMQELFNKCQTPSREERMELAQRICVTEHQIQIWFKNQRAKHKWKNPQTVPEGVLETTGSSKAICGSTGSRGHLFVLAFDNEVSMSPGTSGVGSIPKLNPCPEPSLHVDKALEGTRYSPKENLLHFESLDAAANPGQPKAKEPPTDPVVAEGASSAEAHFSW